MSNDGIFFFAVRNVRFFIFAATKVNISNDFVFVALNVTKFNVFSSPDGIFLIAAGNVAISLFGQRMIRLFFFAATRITISEIFVFVYIPVAKFMEFSSPAVYASLP